MTTKTFDTCTLPEVCFMSFGNEEKKRIQIKSNKDYEDNFIVDRVEKRTDDEWTILAVEYRMLKAEIKQKEKRLEQLRDALVSMSETACSIGGGLMVEQCERKGAIQYSAIPQLISVDLEHYRGEPIKYWKVTEV